MVRKIVQPVDPAPGASLFGPLKNAELMGFSRLRPWRTARDLALTWTAALLVIDFGIHMRNVWSYIAAFLAMGFVQNALVLWTHEGSHYGLARRKWLNDLLTDMLAAGPTGVSVGQYRWQHFRHHQYLGDPTQEVDLSAWTCIRGWQLPATVARHAAGWFGWKILHRYQLSRDDPRVVGRPRRSSASVVGALVANGGLFLMAAWQRAPSVYFLLWVLPMFTLTLLISNLRTIVEHQPSSDVCDEGLVPIPAITHWVDYNWVERLLVAPIGFAYHYEHHLYPGVPYSRLKDLRGRLVRASWLRDMTVVRPGGYFRTLWCLCRVPEYGVRLPKRSGQATFHDSSR